MRNKNETTVANPQNSKRERERERERVLTARKNSVQPAALPKILFRFYVKYGARNYYLSITAWAILFLITYGANGVVFPLFQKWFIHLFEQPVPAGMTFVQFALPTILTIVGIWIFVDICVIVRSIITGRWRPKVQNQISEVLNGYVHSQSMSFWTKRMAGKINSQIGFISSGFFSISTFMEMFTSVMIMILNVGLVMSINYRVALVLGAVFAFRLVYSLLLMRPMNKASKTAADSASSLTGKLVDSIANYSIVKMFAGIGKEEKALKEPRRKSILTRIQSMFWQRMFWGVPMFVWDISFGATMILCCMFFVSGEMQVSQIVFTISVYFSVMGAISRIVGVIPDLVDTLGSASTSYSELVKPIDIQDAPDAQGLDVSGGAIEIKNVSFKYNNTDDKDKNKRRVRQPHVLQNFSLKIAPGERVGLVGSSGAGKTTLVNLLMRFYDPDNGAIFIDGQNIRDVTQNSLRENIAFIPQDPTMFNRTLCDNIGYGRDGATIAQIKRAAKQAQADAFIMATDKKYDSVVGDRGIKLSGGQRQRIAIARVP